MVDNPIIEIEALSHRYGAREALRGISFAVGAGEVFGLLGPNGGGKTTTFKILSTLLKPTGGRARVGGIDVAADPAAVRRQIGVVFQAASVDLKLTVAENLRHQGHLYGLRGAALRARAGEVLGRLGLAERSGELVDRLSGGLRRRVELAKAFLHRPPVLLLDEPSTGLDPGARRELWDYLASLRARDGVTIVLTTHIMEEAEGCDRLGILDQGRLVALDSPAALKAQIGGDVITAQTREPEQLRRKIQDRFGAEAAVVGDTVRVERERGHEFIAALVEAFPRQITSITLGQPTLEDVFIRRTGHRFSDEAGT
jgi:ABC-2 type transport system ATP-binding protein